MKGNWEDYTPYFNGNKRWTAEWDAKVIAGKCMAIEFPIPFRNRPEIGMVHYGSDE